MVKILIHLCFKIIVVKIVVVVLMVVLTSSRFGVLEIVVKMLPLVIVEITFNFYKLKNMVNCEEVLKL